MASNNYYHNGRQGRSNNYPSASLPVPPMPPQPLYPMPPYPTAPYPTVPYPTSPYPIPMPLYTAPSPPLPPRSPRNRPAPLIPNINVGPTLVDNFVERAHTRLEPRRTTNPTWTEDALTNDLQDQLAGVKRSIQDIVSQEFHLPGDIVPRVTIRLSAVDLRPDGTWHHGRGELWRTGAAVLMPKIVIRMPERRAPERRGTGRRIATGPTPRDRAYMDAGKRVLDAVVHGRGLNRYDVRTDLRGLPFDPAGDLPHACFEFSEGEGSTEDVCNFMPTHVHVYLPAKVKRVDNRNTWFYERLYGGNSRAITHLTSWASRRNIDLSFLTTARA
ncbi:hypothetical protein F5Y00DRAFT_269644 [Daldinia vernicosa]|uniref:uncharacterized protein n=1 Tax=Daldinia vernicosa TaxID=114800 RepID=UPI002007D3A0|nr:uncharacterized protein F5Y00DRAFT_269644 [Daldinia vernicosa]KAI0849323.1 hypothetical protein F5Y00DRAFT_269644 [Daldinia vernicosa]